jgi:choline dehydrogenase
VGLRYRQHGQDHEVRAAREVVLSAGALQSPQLLQLSGVGDAARLQALGIPVSHHLPGVGENLQDHLQLRLMYKVKKPITTNDDLQSWWRQFKMGWKWITERKGPLAIGINQGGMFTRILPESTTPDIQFHFASVSAEMAGAKPHPWSGCTFSVCQLRPHSRGTVFVKSRDPLQAPSMLPNYLSHETDQPLRRGLDQVRAPPGGGAGAGRLHPRGIPARPRRCQRRGNPGLGAQLRRHDLPSRPAPARWATTRWR